MADRVSACGPARRLLVADLGRCGGTCRLQLCSPRDANTDDTLETLDLATIALVHGGKGGELHALGALFKDFRKITHEYGLAGSAASVKVVADGLRGKHI